MFTVRMARPEDTKEIVALWDLLTRADTPPPGPRWQLTGDAIRVWRGHLVDHFMEGAGAVYVAEDEGSVVGFVAVDERRISPLFPVGRVGRIDSLFVRPSHQGRGVGRALVNAAEAWLGARGFETVEVKTFFNNVASRAVWTHLGYRPTVLTFEKPLTSAGEELRRAPRQAPSGSPPDARSAGR